MLKKVTKASPDNNESQKLKDVEKELALLQEKCAFLERVVHEVPANIYISDLEKGLVWCNKTNEETLGYTLSDILKMGGLQYFKEVVHPEDQNVPDDSVDHYQHFTGAEYGGIFRAKHKDQDNYRWFVGWAKAYNTDDKGNVKELLCVDVDMSPQMNTEKQLIEALRENLKLKNKLLFKSLRKRELEILNLICKGMSTKNIADKLFLSLHTVTTHRRNIQKKLGTSNVADLVSLAKETGLG
ncbi:LuxR C-terminal-related transcriptional regulator [Pontibacter silvestris]|uniref:LuxR C-terminal-related transcriptional regulator n=1 Tax=Pontibacter silvestris TaxID=2305183 RepID=A0ABW4X0L3_9BACT|nr:LuxR C-terminal-related transcriptional regulator [Pontibacter silvestris]MCC9136018.1 LuxR C-terminal-related transcriptional regulator [Pontibacter silvestris]